ncbi:MAG: SRPBCC family protein, partial [Thermoplasmata archaeon]|nr:SRPBCC family protein [Thermoplasmata archaeon]
MALRPEITLAMLASVDVTRFRAAASVVIDAPAEVLFDFIADMPRMAEISPVNTGGAWETDARGVGATFMGTNVMPNRSWSARMRIVVSGRPRAIAWCNLGGAGLPLSDDLPHNVRWRYDFTPVEGGTRVDETWQFLETAGQRYFEVIESCDYSVD